ILRGSSFLSSFSLIVVNDVAQDYVSCNRCLPIIAYRTAAETGGLIKHFASCRKSTLSSSSSNTTQSSLTTSIAFLLILIQVNIKYEHIFDPL
ncbi:unnamed protein product, partial [Adineta steineri]